MLTSSEFLRLLMAVVAEKAIEWINRSFSPFIHHSQEWPISHARFCLFT
jgi:hypothetical protein